MRYVRRTHTPMETQHPERLWHNIQAAELDAAHIDSPIMRNRDTVGCRRCREVEGTHAQRHYSSYMATTTTDPTWHSSVTPQPTPCLPRGKSVRTKLA